MIYSIYTEPSREKVLKPKILSFSFDSYQSPAKKNEVTEIFQAYTKENENLYMLFKDIDMVKYVGVKEWKFFAMVFKNRITKRILGGRNSGKIRG
jgi:hypothetical protein